ncbi:hypothetical protein TNCV_1267611 [Trichonephila clavipes]|nr:hypothetical protein TNCV_1267611 [Trichonephila clavipes]
MWDDQVGHLHHINKSEVSPVSVLDSFTRSPQKLTSQCARKTGLSRACIDRILQRAKWLKIMQISFPKGRGPLYFWGYLKSDVYSKKPRLLEKLHNETETVCHVIPVGNNLYNHRFSIQEVHLKTATSYHQYRLPNVIMRTKKYNTTPAELRSSPVPSPGRLLLRSTVRRTRHEPGFHARQLAICVPLTSRRRREFLQKPGTRFYPRHIRERNAYGRSSA